MLSLKGTAETAEESAPATGITAGRAGRVFASGARMSYSIVASSSSTNVPYPSFLHFSLPGRLMLKFFIEGEDGPFGGLMDVSCSTSSASELGARLW